MGVPPYRCLDPNAGTAWREWSVTITIPATYVMPVPLMYAMPTRNVRHAQHG